MDRNGAGDVVALVGCAPGILGCGDAGGQAEVRGGSVVGMDAQQADDLFRSYVVKEAIAGLSTAEARYSAVIGPDRLGIEVERVAALREPFLTITRLLDDVAPVYMDTRLALDTSLRRALCLADGQGEACNDDPATFRSEYQFSPDLTIRHIECLHHSVGLDAPVETWDAYWGAPLGGQLRELQRLGLELYNEWIVAFLEKNQLPMLDATIPPHECSAALSDSARHNADYFWTDLGALAGAGDVRAQQLLETIHGVVDPVEQIRSAAADAKATLISSYPYLLLKGSPIGAPSCGTTWIQDIASTFAAPLLDRLLAGEQLSSGDIEGAIAQYLGIIRCTQQDLSSINPVDTYFWQEWTLDALGSDVGIVKNASSRLAADLGSAGASEDEIRAELAQVFGLGCDGECESAWSRSQRAMYEREEVFRMVQA